MNKQLEEMQKDLFKKQCDLDIQKALVKHFIKKKQSEQLTIPVVVKSFYCLDEVHRGKEDVCQRQCEYCRKNNKQ